jgi:hypothetical protein
MTADAGLLSVSLNGVDNVGKTTQLGWLHRGMPDAHLVGIVDAWDSRWHDVAGGDFAQWWFVGSTNRRARRPDARQPRRPPCRERIAGTT